jgi:hypothetical protein
MKIDFNSDPEVVLACRNTKIVFVHVGKCAGETIMSALHTMLSDDFQMFEMHCYDANKRIKTLIESGRDDVFYIVSKRDPVERFVSAFNWDKHNLFLNGKIAGTGFDECYELFPTAEVLIQGCISQSAAIREKAWSFLRFAHMGMSQSWYTPEDVVKALPQNRTMVCDAATLRQDIEAVLKRFGVPRPEPGWTLPRLKTGYAETYPDSDTLFDRNLSPFSEELLKRLIAPDFRVYGQLSTTFRNHLPDEF